MRGIVDRRAPYIDNSDHTDEDYRVIIIIHYHFLVLFTYYFTVITIIIDIVTDISSHNCYCFYHYKFPSEDSQCK